MLLLCLICYYYMPYTIICIYIFTCMCIKQQCEEPCKATGRKGRTSLEVTLKQD